MLTRVQPISATEAVAQRVLEMIESGTLKPGDRLPSEEEMTAAFGVGRSSVREAKRLLLAKSLLESRGSKGTFVVQKSVEDVLSTGTIHRLLATETLKALEEAREMLEIRSVELATLRAGEDDLAAMAACLQAMADEAKHGRLLYQAGLDFHRALVGATQNPVFEKLYEVITGLLEVHQAPTYPSHANAEREYAEHKAIYDALAQRDRDQIIRLMRQHLNYVKEIDAGSADGFPLAP